MAQMNMSRTELVDQMAEMTGMSKADCGKALNAVTDVISSSVAKGTAVTLPGIGKISRRERGPRTVRNPRTGEAFDKPADNVPKMTFAKAIKEACNG